MMSVSMKVGLDLVDRGADSRLVRLGTGDDDSPLVW